MKTDVTMYSDVIVTLLVNALVLVHRDSDTEQHIAVGKNEV